MSRVELAPVAAADQLKRMGEVVGACTASATDFLRMGQDGYDVPEHYTNPQMVVRTTLEGEPYEVPAIDPLIAGVYSVGSLYIPSEWKEKRESLDHDHVNGIFRAATETLVDAFEPDTFEAFVDAQPPELAEAIRTAGSNFVWHWSGELLDYTTDATLIRDFMGSVLFQRLYPSVDRDGDDLSTRLVAHIVSLEGPGVVGEPSLSYQALVRHIRARLANGCEATAALGLVIRHTPTEVLGLLATASSDPEAADRYRSSSISSLIRCIAQGATADHSSVLEKLSQPFRDTVKGRATLAHIYDEDGVAPPAELLNSLREDLANPEILAGAEGSGNAYERGVLEALLARYP